MKPLLEIAGSAAVLWVLFSFLLVTAALVKLFARCGPVCTGRVGSCAGSPSF